MLSQFTPEPGSRWQTLASFIPVSAVYPAGRLDADSEGLLLLTSEGRLQHHLTDPRFGHWRRYLAQVEGEASQHHGALQQLRRGLVIQGKRTRPANVQVIQDPGVGERHPPIRTRLSVPTSWLEIELQEGRNRQVRRMTAAVGLPTLRLVRVGIDLMDGDAPLGLGGLKAGQWRAVNDSESRRLVRLVQGRGGRAGSGKSGHGGGGG